MLLLVEQLSALRATSSSKLRPSRYGTCFNCKSMINSECCQRTEINDYNIESLNGAANLVVNDMTISISIDRSRNGRRIQLIEMRSQL